MCVYVRRGMLWNMGWIAQACGQSLSKRSAHQGWAVEIKRELIRGHRDPAEAPRSSHLLDGKPNCGRQDSSGILSTIERLCHPTLARLGDSHKWSDPAPLPAHQLINADICRRSIMSDTLATHHKGSETSRSFKGIIN